MVIASINMVPMAKILACVALMASWFVCVAKYLGRVLMDAAPFARPEHAERTEDLSEVAREAVEERFCMRWAMVRIMGKRHGEKKVSKIRGNNERYGCRGMVSDRREGNGGE